MAIRSKRQPSDDIRIGFDAGRVNWRGMGGGMWKKAFNFENLSGSGGGPVMGRFNP